MKQFAIAIACAVVLGAGVVLFLKGSGRPRDLREEGANAAQGARAGSDWDGASGSGGAGSRGSSGSAGRGAGKSSSSSSSAAGRGPGSGAGSGTKGSGEGAGDEDGTAEGAAKADRSREPLTAKGTSGLLVQVLDDQGQTLAGVAITLTSAQGYKQGTSDDQGRAEFRSLPAGSYTATVDAAAGPLSSGSGIYLQPNEVKKVTLRCGSQEHAISGRALDEAGNLLAAVAVEISSVAGRNDVIDLWAHPEGVLRATTDRDGAYEIPDLPAGTFDLTAVWSVTGERLRKSASAPARGVDLVFKKPCPILIAGTCAAPDGSPVGDATVYLVGQNPVSTRSDQSGAYRIETKTTSWAGTIYLRATKEGYRRAEQTIEVTEDAAGKELRVDFVLEPTQGDGSIAGTLSDTAKEPVPGETILLTSDKTRAHYNGRSGPAGDFSFTGLEPSEDYRISIFPRARYKDLRLNGIQVQNGETTNLALVIEPAERGTVYGTAYDAKETPLRGFVFRVRSAKSWSQEVKIVSGPDGSFRAEDVPCGDLMFDTQTSPHYTINGLTLAEGEEKAVDLIFGKGDGEVSGTVTGASGAAAPGARLVFTWSRKSGSLVSSVQHTKVTDQQGSYRLSDLAPGEYQIELHRPGGSVERDRRTLDRGQAQWDFKATGAAE